MQTTVPELAPLAARSIEAPCLVKGLRGPCWVTVKLRGRQAGQTPDGYSKVFYQSKNYMAHCLSWILLRGPIAEGLQIDHRCRRKACWNPDHLQPVSAKINAQRRPRGNTGAHNRRKTHCPALHPYEGYNLIITPAGGRMCRECNRLRLNDGRKNRGWKRS